jgi:hypothetical protein
MIVGEKYDLKYVRRKNFIFVKINFPLNIHKSFWKVPDDSLYIDVGDRIL